MAASITIYGDPISGNCLKVKWVADFLGLSYDWRSVDVLSGSTRVPELLQLNPSGKVPVVVLQDGRVLSESNAIMLFLAEGSALVPSDPFARGLMYQWLFWEQYSHEPYIAVRRFQLALLKRSADELDPKLLERGDQALATMERSLAKSEFLVGDAMTLADIALVAYTRMAGDGGYDLSAFPAVQAWIIAVEDRLGIGRYELQP
jgi:glutathione S-transferase